MPLVQQVMSVSTAEALCGRANRELRYLTTAYTSYTQTREKVRKDLERRLDRVANDRMRETVERALARLDQEDAEVVEEGAIGQGARMTRPAHRIVRSFL